MKYGKGTLTTVYDRVNFYRDVHDDPHVTFKREGDKITLISGDGTIINDKLIAKTEDVFDHKFDTYTPLKKQLNPDQKIILEWLKKSVGSEGALIRAIFSLYHLNLVREEFFDRKPQYLIEVRTALRKLSRQQEAQVLQAFSRWALEQEE